MDTNYRKICVNLIKGLNERTSDVIVRRFGLKSGQNETLEAIGQSYDITRERVRQIEREGLIKVRNKAKELYSDVFDYFVKTLNSIGGIKEESALVNLLGKEKDRQQILFLLTLAEGTKRFPEDKDFHSFWAVSDSAFDSAKKTINSAITEFEKVKKPLTLKELFELVNSVSFNVFESHVGISKTIQKNQEGKLGIRNWVEINPKGIKDRAYLVFKKAGKSLHFTEVAKMIEGFYENKRKAHVATVHNELIKDGRFVLVGRGLYALKEWGYEPGVVKDVIVKVLKDSEKPLSKDEVIQAVLKQRMVKENTVFLNLQNKNLFEKNSEGKYTVRES